MNAGKTVNWTIFALLAVMASFIGYKLFYLDYDMKRLVPLKSYNVSVSMKYTGYGEDLIVRTYLPESERSQDITGVLNSSSELLLEKNFTGDSVLGEWRGYNIKGPGEISYSFQAHIKSIDYRISPQLLIPEIRPPELEVFLLPTENIQSESPEIKNLALKLKDPERNLEKTIHNIYSYISEFGNKPFKGTTDALTALRLGAASCNGKSRLLVAISRQLGIPSRLVGGLILTSGSKRVTHQWAEFYVNGYWVPVDALNKHYLSIPDNYLVLYRGDHVMFRYSKNIGFSYRYDITKRTVPNLEMEEYLGVWNLNLYSFLHSFKRVNISLNLLKIILMIPIGVLVVVISRNIIGINTFGTFLPALMAVAVRETGLTAGIIAFIFTIIIVTVIRFPLQKMGILHTPKLAIMMVGVVVSIFSLTILSDFAELKILSRLGAASLFPIAILTITAERFAIILEEEGFKEVTKILIQTMIVMSVCYLLMNSLVIQTLVLAFPEILLGVVAFNLWIGSWIGIRVSELFRFKSILFPIDAVNTVGILGSIGNKKSEIPGASKEGDEEASDD